MFGVSCHKIDLLLQEKASYSGTIKLLDNHEHHELHNQMNQDRKDMRNHIKKYQKYQRLRSRRHSNKLYHQRHLSIKKLYEKYTKEKNNHKCGSYGLLKSV